MNELELHRKEIELIDKELIILLAKRFSTVEKIADYKAKNNISVYQENQWKKVLSKVLMRWDQAWLHEEFIELVWKEIHKHSLLLQYKRKGMYLDVHLDSEN